MLIFQSTTKCLNLANCQGKLQCVFHHSGQCPHKVWPRLDEKCRRSGVLEFLVWRLWGWGGWFVARRVLSRGFVFGSPTRGLRRSLLGHTPSKGRGTYFHAPRVRLLQES